MGLKTLIEWESVLQAGYTQPLAVFQKVIPCLKEEASVVRFSGITSKQYSEGYQNTNVVRMAWAAQVKNLMYQLSQKKVRVNLISPGFILTPFNLLKVKSRASELGLEVREYLKTTVDKLPLKRYGAPEEVADVVSFFLNKKSRHVNGVNLVVDGGESVAY